MNKQELLDKAMHELKGKLPSDGCPLYREIHGYICRMDAGGSFYPSSICSIEEFKQRARELGYGVEAAEPDSWYCYETQKALRLPPVGVECEVKSSIGWTNCIVLARGNCRDMGSVLFWQAAHDCGTFHSVSKFRPLDWNRKAEAERNNLLEIVYKKWNERGDIKEVAEYLHDAGYLRLPADKS